eukprot:TRINITY_DN705_c0_g1_i1.p1 TRINITY_DN705_c0_g1~~TRINITY_DN705_c0_g1_i1.p1  ORF type:complete len:104 (-),score=11.36 TRINITY_DN705_c0_g1_i1:122-433(-)
MIWKGFIVLTVLANVVNSAHFDHPANANVVEIPFEIIVDQDTIIIEPPIQPPTAGIEEIVPDEETDLDYYPDPNTDPEMYRDYYDDYFDTYYYDEEPRDSADI